MGINEEKTEKQNAFREFVVVKAYDLIKENGCEALSMRKLAESIEWSTQKLYSNFRNKEELLLAIDQYIRGRINKKMKGVSRGPDPLENVIALASTTLHFFLQEPAAIEVLKEVRYKQEETPSPREDKAQQLFRDAVSDLQCPALIQPAAFEEALEAIRVMLVGAGECIRITKPQKREVVLTATLNGLRSLIKGWGYHPH